MRGRPDGLLGGGLLQVSDPHFGTEQPGAVDALVRLVATRRPALVLLSGDLTQRATVAQFGAVRDFVARLHPVPVLAIPGNHDIPLFDLWSRLRHPYARYEAALGPVHDHEFRSAGWHVLMLNTTRWWRHKNGEVSAAQLEATCLRLLDAAPGALKVVVTHQPVAVPSSHDRKDLLRGAAKAVAAWHAAGADLILGGHIHLPCVLPLRPAPRPLWAVQAGTAVSTRVRHGTLNSVTEILAVGGPDGAGRALNPASMPGLSGVGPDEAGQRRCIVRYWDWPAGQLEFVPRPDVDLPLASRVLDPQR